MHGPSMSFLKFNLLLLVSAFQGATSPVRQYKERAGGYGEPRLDWGVRVLCRYVTVSWVA